MFVEDEVDRQLPGRKYLITSPLPLIGLLRADDLFPFSQFDPVSPAIRVVSRDRRNSWRESE